MKTTVIAIILFMTGLAIYAQKATLLDETKLVYSPFTQVSSNGDIYTYKINENAGRRFAQNPLEFMYTNFDIQKFIAQTAKKKYDYYEVTFISKNGSLVAEFDQKGNLMDTQQHFKNVILPRELRENIYNTNKGWSVVSAIYQANTKGEIIQNATYKVSLVNGDQHKKLKLDAKQLNSGVAVY